MSHVDARAVVGGLSDGDRVELALRFGDQGVTIRHGQTSSPSKSFPDRSNPEDGEPFVSTWADDDPDDDVYGRVSQLGADAAVVHLSLPFPIRTGTPLTVTVRAPVDATLLPVTVLVGGRRGSTNRNSTVV